jgi:co-chaperonin GroES (HSP10)
VFRLPKGRIALDSIIVVPKTPPRKSAGGIEYPGRSRAAELANTTVGQVLLVGPLAYTTVTRDGLDFSKAEKAKEGDWVIYTRNAGQNTLLRDEQGHYGADMTDCPRFLILSDADIKFIFDSKEEADLVWSWVR